MTDQQVNHVFLSYSEDNRDFVEKLAKRLKGDARLSFWFHPWHSIVGKTFQEQMEDALWDAQACAVFISGSGQIEGWQNEQMRAAIQTRVEDEPNYRIIPVLLPDTTRLKKRNLPRFLRLYEPVKFRTDDDEQAFRYLLSGILGIRPIEVEGFIEAETKKAQLDAPPSEMFEQGHAVVIGIANYARVSPLPEAVLNDARDFRTQLTNPAICAYPPDNVVQLLDRQATANRIRSALHDLAARTAPDDTAVLFFSGHGNYDDTRQYLLPYGCELADLPGTAIAGEEMTALLGNIKAGRLLVLFDCCHSGGVADPKGPAPQVKSGLSSSYIEALAQGKGRVVIASSRQDEFSWALPRMRNSLFTHYLLEALRGKGPMLGDGYVRAFDLFRHVANHVPAHLANYAAQYPTSPQLQQASQNPIFKAAMETDFPIAFTRR